MVYSSKEQLQEEYGRWLSSVFGQLPQVGLGTYTFRPPDGQSSSGAVWDGIGRQFAMRAARQLESFLMANGSTYFVALEEGSLTRRLHLHSLESNDRCLKDQIHQWWEKRYGFESYRRVNSLKGVSMYVTKYVVKSDLPFLAGGPLYKSAIGGMMAAAGVTYHAEA